MYIVGTRVEEGDAVHGRPRSGKSAGAEPLLENQGEVQPAATRAFMMKFWPKQWNSGSAQSPRSSDGHAEVVHRRMGVGQDSRHA